MALAFISGHPRGMACGRLPLIAFLLAAAAGILMLTSARATGARRDQTPCNWGASSVRAQVVDGKLQTSEPATSGCIPK